MNDYHFGTMSEALPAILHDLLENGYEVGSRNGRVKEMLNPQITITDPRNREVLSIGRKANVFAQIAETMWVLSGRSDIEWLSAYLPRAVDYSDDGVYWRGGYGPRLRSHFGFDQVEHVVDLLKADPLSRRAVISIYDPGVDAAPGKDIPCNDFLQFQSRGGYLHLTVTVRSNDAMWGWSGINAFEWSTLQEIVASLLGIRVGNLVFNIGSLHLYEPHWDRASRISYEDPAFMNLRPIRFNPDGVITDLWQVDAAIDEWFTWEGMCRSGAATPGLLDSVAQDPLFKAWSQAIAYFWTRDTAWLADLHGTALAVAIARTPVSVLSEARTVSQAPAPVVVPTTALSDAARRFYEFVTNLHAAKHASYGDSWKKRGEKMSILANIARKVDRLGVGDEFDTSADTLLDFLVYLIKYRNWIDGIADTPEEMNKGLLWALEHTQHVAGEDDWQRTIPRDFDYYADNVDGLSDEQKSEAISQMILRVAPIALDTWHAENEYRGADAD